MMLTQLCKGRLAARKLPFGFWIDSNDGAAATSLNFMGLSSIAVLIKTRTCTSAHGVQFVCKTVRIKNKDVKMGCGATAEELSLATLFTEDVGNRAEGPFARVRRICLCDGGLKSSMVDFTS